MHAPVLSWWPLLLAIGATGPAGAQPDPAPPSPPAYRSAFEDYRPFGDQPVESWKGANDTVGRIGGWKAYAQEASGQGSPQHPVVPAQARSPSDAPAALPKAQAPDSRLRGNDGK